MPETVNPIPDEYHTATPYLIVDDGAGAIAYYEKAFGASEQMRLQDPGSGKLMHAEIRIGDSTIMLADEAPEMGFKSPRAFGGSPVSIALYVADVDSVFSRALEAGGKELRQVQDQFYGDRSGTIEDPFGHVWTLGSRIENLSAEEMSRKFEEMMQQHQQPPPPEKGSS